ncbi:MAG: signal peptidase I [Clostridia bacterium]|nr:signal peptidase I [Clostridia bacterium]
MKNQIKSFIFILLFSVAIAFVITHFLIVNVIVPTGSMIPVVNENDRLFANRLSYVFSEPERGDIIVFDSRFEDKLLLKRIIGLPGESLKIENGLIYINGEPIEDFSEIEMKWNYTPEWDVIPEGMYFVLGDNRNNSLDSPEWELYHPDIENAAFVDEKVILGKVLFKYFPKFKLF